MGTPSSKPGKSNPRLPSGATTQFVNSVVVSGHSPPSKSNTHRPYHSWLAYLTALLLLLTASGVVVGVAWAAVQYLLNPEALPFLQRWLPQSQRPLIRGIAAPQTLAEIRQSWRYRQKTTGEFFSLGSNRSFLDGRTPVAEFLLPVLQTQAGCATPCQAIVELQLYQAMPHGATSSLRPMRFYLVNQWPIAKTEEAFIVTTLMEADGMGASRQLPLTTLTRFEGAPGGDGIWLNLSGVTHRHNLAIAYGQVLYYNPRSYHLSPLLEWASPAGKSPQWERFEAQALPELVIDQTMGMEPRYQIYRVEPARFVVSPLQLRPISLLEPGTSQQGYETALLLARTGLWSNSLRWIETLRQRANRRSGQWNRTAQAQRRLIAKHAAIAQTQAKQLWASSSQQILANLLDGRWQAALSIVEANPEVANELASLLRANAGRLHQRVQVTLRLDPGNRPAKAWGALLIAAQVSPASAIAWLKKQPRTTPTDIDYISTLLAQI